MKKSFLLLITLFMSTMMMAQDLPISSSTNKVTYIDVINADGLTAKQIYEAAKKWGQEQGWAVIEDDATKGKIKFNAKIDLGWPGLSGGQIDKGFTALTITVFGKDGKYRYILTDFIHKGISKSPSGGDLENPKAECGPTRMTARGWVTIKDKTGQGADAIVSSLKQLMLELKNDPENNDDW